MLIETSDNIDSLYINSLIHLAEDGYKVGGVQDINSPGSQDSFLENSPAILTLTNPRHRVLKVKRFDVFNAIGQFLWILNGSDSQAAVEFYNPVAKFFADDDSGKLYGPWGERISPQIETVVNLLKVDPSSRRAVIPVFIPKDVGHSSKNLPCCVSLQFLIRGGRLTCNVLMRSSNAFGVLPYDLFMLTMVHEYIASCIPAPLGEFRFIANSFHIYEKDMPRLNEMLESTRSFKPERDSYPPMPPMPALTGIGTRIPPTPSAHIQTIGGLEAKIQAEGTDLDGMGLDIYWTDIMSVVLARYKKLHTSEDEYLVGRESISDQMSYEPLSSLIAKS